MSRLIPPTADRIASQLRLFIEPGQVAELRALDVGGPYRTFAGWFEYDHLRDMARHAIALSREASGVYFTPNPVDPAILARKPNTTSNVPSKKSPQHFNLTTDRDVLCRRFLIVDLDPVRIEPASPNVFGAKPIAPESPRIPRDSQYRVPIAQHLQKQPSTAEEIRIAQAFSELVSHELQAKGWAPPITMLSGNGIHLIFRLSSPLPYLPPELDPLCQLLKALSTKFTNPDWIVLDTNTYNATRMLKVPGTWSRKGEQSPCRPYRRAEIIEVPDGWSPTQPPESARSDGRTDAGQFPAGTGRNDAKSHPGLAAGPGLAG